MYDHDYSDFYETVSPFEEQVSEFKQSLLQSVKQEFLNEMDQLRKENEELQEVKKNFKGVVKQYENKKYELENEYNNLKRKVRSERLYDLLEGEHKMIMYKATSNRVYPDKCNKCDKYRQVTYTTPLGREAKEDCECKNAKLMYIPKEQIRYEFRLNGRDGGITAFYRPYTDRSDEGLVYESDSTHADKVYKEGMDFEKLKSWNTFFKTKEECQKYCDYLTEKENNK